MKFCPDAPYGRFIEQRRREDDALFAKSAALVIDRLGDKLAEITLELPRSSSVPRSHRHL
jgi:hypothetical protein